ncbi:zeta toxin family protein [Pseudoalteromonas sp. T1lg23B]|uniref:zeta toxin family protein n=1 Tax=Pseudoalteromonas sp. T1lg23B TaxID=2077097 RepID=UPI000CF5EBA3|nr:zeta toxin family protein [Pseudoalteromonas sp. T1lg23B]
MLEINDVVYSVTGYQYNEMAKVFTHLAIDELDWSHAQAQAEFETLITAKLANQSRQISPVFEVVSGIPFSGKSSFIKSKKREFEGYLFISFDALMKELSFYQRLMELDSKLAFNKCELVARIIGYELLQRAVDLGCHIVFEHSSTPKQHLALYEVIEKEYGYKLVINYIQCPLALAKQRAEQNNSSLRDGGRYTPVTYIDERFHALQAMMGHYKQHFLVKEVEQSEFAPH